VVKILSAEFPEDETILVKIGKEKLKFTVIESDQLVAP
jgi:hypothetical protein